jgi:hypothetical protein
MALGQAAGTAAVLAIENNTTVQNVNYEELRNKLLAGDQVLKIYKSKYTTKWH